MSDLIRKLDDVARDAEASRVTRVTVRLGALSHFTVNHFREHFVGASIGTVAEGATVDVVVDTDVADPRARDVVLTSVEVEA
jgi:hydrogenase nickel incorporation protein HypA/HybF